jgi:RNA polymerase primary sigma factor
MCETARNFQSKTCNPIRCLRSFPSLHSGFSPTMNGKTPIFVKALGPHDRSVPARLDDYSAGTGPIHAKPRRHWVCESRDNKLVDPPVMVKACTPRNDLLAPLEIYLQEINVTPLLNAEQERALAVRIQAGDKAARDHMVRANLRLVVSVAQQYANRGLSLADLIEEGNLGLLTAVSRFDPARKTRFSTYATFWIKQAIRQGLIKTGTTVRLPNYMVQLVSKWKQASSLLTDRLGRAPTHEEVADHLQLSKKRQEFVQQALRIHNSAVPFDEIAGMGLEQSLQARETAPQDDETEPEETHRVHAMLAAMDPKHATVLRMRFGLDDDGPKTLREIGSRLGLSSERVRQIERAALDKLGRRLRAG